MLLLEIKKFYIGHLEKLLFFKNNRCFSRYMPGMGINLQGYSRSPIVILCLLVFFRSVLFSIEVSKYNNLGLSMSASGKYEVSDLKGSSMMGTYDLDNISIMPLNTDYKSIRTRIIIRYKPFPGLSVRQQTIVDAVPMPDRRSYAIDGEIGISHNDFSFKFGWIPLFYSPFVIYGDPSRYRYDVSEGREGLFPEKTSERWLKGVSLKIKKLAGTELYASKENDIWNYGLHSSFNIDEMNFKVNYLNSTEYFNNFKKVQRDIRIFDIGNDYKISRKLRLFGEIAYSICDKDINDSIQAYEGLAYHLNSEFRYKSSKWLFQYMDIDRFYTAPLGFVKNLSFENNWDYISDPFERSFYYYTYGIIMNNRAGFQNELNFVFPPYWLSFLNPIVLNFGHEIYKDKEPTSYRGETKIDYSFIKYEISINLPVIKLPIGYMIRIGEVKRDDDIRTDFDNEKIDLSAGSQSFTLHKEIFRGFTVFFKMLIQEYQKGKEEKVILIDNNNLLNSNKQVERLKKGILLALNYEIPYGLIGIKFQDIKYENSRNHQEDYEGQNYSLYYSMSY